MVAKERKYNKSCETAEDIVYRIEQGLLDMGLMFDYVNKEKISSFDKKNKKSGVSLLEKIIIWHKRKMYFQRT